MRRGASRTQALRPNLQHAFHSACELRSRPALLQGCLSEANAPAATTVRRPPISIFRSRQAKSLPAPANISTASLTGAGDASRSRFDHHPAASPTGLPLSMRRLRSRKPLDQPLLLDSATETAHPAKGTGRRPFKFPRFCVIANSTLSGFSDIASGESFKRALTAVYDGMREQSTGAMRRRKVSVLKRRTSQSVSR